MMWKAETARNMKCFKLITYLDKLAAQTSPPA